MFGRFKRQVPINKTGGLFGGFGGLFTHSEPRKKSLDGQSKTIQKKAKKAVRRNENRIKKGKPARRYGIVSPPRIQQVLR